jgi:hypothetical protein
LHECGNRSSDQFANVARAPRGVGHGLERRREGVEEMGKKGDKEGKEERKQEKVPTK